MGEKEVDGVKDEKRRKLGVRERSSCKGGWLLVVVKTKPYMTAHAAPNGALGMVGGKEAVV